MCRGSAMLVLHIEVRVNNAEVKLVKCIVQNIVVNISFNQIAGLCTLCFLEKVDRLIGKEHLFKHESYKDDNSISEIQPAKSSGLHHHLLRDETQMILLPLMFKALKFIVIHP
ncbi:Uncharacterized protein Adt_37018 [Abeliophyllum distichum]|uniref:Uncharacterized protein n=1 Tax=Abeliophyllum distichum TaxID=126358 RepID=A0ABD1QJ73_9LAMI